MMKKKVVYICCVSNDEIRGRLQLKKLSLANFLGKILGKNQLDRIDFAPWNSQFISEFENDPNHEYYIILPYFGMCRDFQEFDIGNIHYFVYNQSVGIWARCKRNLLNWDERTNYMRYRDLIYKKIQNIKPDLVVVCGAENPIYSWSAIDIPSNIPTYILLQTLMNDPKRIEMGVSSEYRAKLESLILKKHKYFGVLEDCQRKYLNEVNPDAQLFDITFPCECPQVEHNEKEFDFMFVAAGVTKNKGIEDTLKAFAKVVEKYPKSLLNISGRVEQSYRLYLQEIIKNKGICGNVSFQPPFKNHLDVFAHMSKTRCLVVPGITAGLNSTVKEGLLLGLPTICYHTTAAAQINNDKHCLLIAKMQDVSDLSNLMISTIENSEYVSEVAKNGYKYAHSHFDSLNATRILIEQFDNILDKV